MSLSPNLHQFLEHRTMCWCYHLSLHFVLMHALLHSHRGRFLKGSGWMLLNSGTQTIRQSQCGAFSFLGKCSMGASSWLVVLKRCGALQCLIICSPALLGHFSPRLEVGRESNAALLSLLSVP